LSLYWKDKKEPLSAQTKQGLANAFNKFDEYQLAKWNKDTDITLRDAMFLVHPRPEDAWRKFTKYERQQGLKPRTEGEKLFAKLVTGSLETPDTWEVASSAGQEDKKSMWTRLLEEGKLGEQALLKNLRNMKEAGVSKSLIAKSLVSYDYKWSLPTQFFAAAKAVPEFSDIINLAMMKYFSGQPKLPGTTAIIVDLSGSMNQPLSVPRGVDREEVMSRMTAAAILAAIIKARSQHCEVWATAGNDGLRQHQTERAEDVNGFELVDSLLDQAHHMGSGGIFIVQTTKFIEAKTHTKYDRCIVITDEQDCDQGADKGANNAVRLGRHNYIMNIAPERYGVVTGGLWHRISGMSYKVVEWLIDEETRGIWKNGN